MPDQPQADDEKDPACLQSHSEEVGVELGRRGLDDGGV